MLPQEAPPAPPRWIEEMIQEMNSVASKLLVGEEDEEPPDDPPPQKHLAIEERACGYCFRVHPWLKARPVHREESADPCAVIGWFHTMIPVKIDRAIHGLAEHMGQTNATGRPITTARPKVALLGIERSHAAWLDLVERGVATHSDAAPFIADLVWLGEVLEREFPLARAFVRPALD